MRQLNHIRKEHYDMNKEKRIFTNAYYEYRDSRARRRREDEFD